ncbi:MULTISPECIES: chemotaxis protein CheB [Anaeromyxobacter]|uniref:chemotaxis protein CheB n=1 Tax=Anaeromyxobacter TaxID=161492 RepID=UPI001F5A7A34|nr:MULTISPECIES: chemotaxis protein CheB [unclassified Anaeromyxobacter]
MAEPRIVVIGGSAGAIETLLEILPALPPGYPLPVVVVVHLPAGQPSLLAEVLGTRSALPVVEAEDKARACPGTVYLAPPDYHLLLEGDGTLALSVDAPVHHSRPAIDPLLESAADAFADGVVAVVLSGASSDGAAGLAAVRRAGGLAIVQDPATASSPLMPEAALRAADPELVLSPAELRVHLAALGRTGVRR